MKDGEGIGNGPSGESRGQQQNSAANNDLALPAPLSQALKEAGVDVGDERVLKILQALEITHTRMAVSSGTHSLPPAMMLEEWEELYPGITEKFVGWLDDQTTHRRALERQRADRSEDRADNGQKYAALAMALGLICSTIVGVWGSAAASAILAIVSVGGPTAATILAGRGLRQRPPSPPNRD